jgi:hypothetical protein
VSDRELARIPALNGLTGPQIKQALADASVLYAFVLGHEWTDVQDARNATGLPADRFNRACELLESAGQIVRAPVQDAELQAIVAHPITAAQLAEIRADVQAVEQETQDLTQATGALGRTLNE